MNNIFTKPINININQSYIESKYPRYLLNDLGSVYTHYDTKLGINVPTKNELPKEDINNDDKNSN